MAFIRQSELENVLYLRMNRSEVKNAFNPAMIEEIREAFLNADKRKDLRAIVLTGEGNVFSAGADLNWMTAMVRYSYEQNIEDAKKLYEMFDSIWRTTIPVICTVRGAAFGGALGLMACCDYVIIEEDVQLAFSEVKLGIAPAVISSFVLRKGIAGRMRFYMMSGKLFSANDALRFSLVHELVKPGTADLALQKVLEIIKDAGPESVRDTKKLLNEAEEFNWHEMKDKSIKLIASRRISSEGQEGLKSFLEKRAPSWRDK